MIISGFDIKCPSHSRHSNKSEICTVLQFSSLKLDIVSTVGASAKMDDKILGNKARMHSRIRENSELDRGSGLSQVR